MKVMLIEIPCLLTLIKEKNYFSKYAARLPRTPEN